MSSSDHTEPDTDRLTTLRRQLAVLDELRDRARSISPAVGNIWYTAWEQLHAEALIGIRDEERRAQGGKNEP
jgi:hypothetical protein